MPPEFSIILPVCHGGVFLQRALESLALLTAPGDGCEVLVAGEKERLKAIADFNFATRGWRFVECDGNRSVALNAACASAQGQVWIFSDDDCRFPADWLLKIEKSLADHCRAAVIGGVDVLTDSRSVFDLALDEALNSFAGTGGIRRASAVKAGPYYPRLWNMTVRAEAARGAAVDAPTGELIFNPSLNVHEDVDLVERIKARGGEVAHDPNVKVGHCRDTDFASFFRRNMAMAQVCKRLSIHRPAHWALIAVLVCMPLLGALSFWVPEVFPFFIGITVVYSAAVVLAGLRGMWKKKRLALAGLVPALIISLHTARATGYLLPLRVPRKDTP